MHLGIIKITYNRTAQPRCYHNAFMDDRFVNLGEEVILPLLWQSGASESSTICFVISLSICYLYLLLSILLFKCRVLPSCVYVCVCERESHSCSVVCVCVCVCVCSLVWERKTRSHNRGLCANTYKLHTICNATLSPFLAWTDGKTKDIINCLYFSFESWSSRLCKG